MSFVIAIGFSALLVPASIFIARMTGMLDRPGDPLKIHTGPVPVLGGLAVIGAAWGGAAAAGHPPSVGVSAAAGIVVAVGVIDGLRPLPAVTRLAAQLAAGVVLAASGAGLTPLGPLSGVGTVLLLVACANATNMIDGQDGLAAGLVILAALGLVVVLDGAGTTQAALLLASAGALSCFLIWNRPPAKVFLGNGGPDGLAVILVTGVAAAGHAHGWRGLLTGGACLGVFLFELVFTFVRRYRRGRLMVGDRSHSYDLLAAEGSSRASVTLRFWAVGGALGVLAFVLRSSSLGVVISVECLIGIVVAVWGRQLWVRRGQAMSEAVDHDRRGSRQIERRLLAGPTPPPGAP